MRIVYCTDSICYPGGIAVTTVTKANAFSEIPGNEVWIVVTDHQFPPILPLSDRIHFINLEVQYYQDDWLSRWHILKGIVLKRHIHKKKLKAFLRSVQPDIVVSTGTSEKDFLPFIKIKSRPVFIREIHFASHYRLLDAHGLFEKGMSCVGSFVDFHLCIHKYDRIVVLTEEDRKNHWESWGRTVIVVPNPLYSNPDRLSDLEKKSVIAAGRLVKPKNFVSLIRAWKIVQETNPDWDLRIWGKGDQKEQLEEIIMNLGLCDSVHLMGYSDDIISQYPDASIFVLSSLFEGFGMSIVEAMSCSLPVVAYACPYGPKDIIEDGTDGFLVPPGDERALAARICELADDLEKRKKMGAAAHRKSEQFSLDKIVAIWMDTFQETLAEKKRKP